MYVGEKLTEDMVLAWATVVDADDYGFEVVGSPIMVKASDNTLVEPGVHEIRYVAVANEGKPNEEVAEKTITLTVKEREATVTPTNTKNDGKTKPIKKAQKELPKTGDKENALASVLGLTMIATVYFMKKRKENEFDLY